MFPSLENPIIYSLEKNNCEFKCISLHLYSSLYDNLAALEQKRSKLNVLIKLCNQHSCEQSKFRKLVELMATFPH